MLARYFNDDNQKILLLRHGELYTGDRKIYVGQTDVPLSGIGVSRAHAWAKEFEHIGITKIITSDLKRCHETAGIIAAKLKLKEELSKKWREISFGEWDGRDWEEVRQEYPKEVAARYADFVNQRPPGGENFLDLQTRVVAAFNDVLAQNNAGVVLIVTHAGVNRTLLAHLMGLPPQGIFNIFQDFACLNIIDVKDGKFKHVRALNLLH